MVVGKVIVAKAIGIYILYIGIIRFVINWTGGKEWLNEQKSISYSAKFNLIKWPELDEDIQLGDAEQKFVYLHQAFGGLIQDLLELLLNRKWELLFPLIEIEVGKREIFVVCGSLG